jgi:hypothetical protein
MPESPPVAAPVFGAEIRAFMKKLQGDLLNPASQNIDEAKWYIVRVHSGSEMQIVEYIKNKRDVKYVPEIKRFYNN